MVVFSPARFAAEVRAYRFEDVVLDPEALALASAALAEAGLLVVGEPHGVRETPSVLYALVVALGTRAIAFEWSHEELEEPVQELARGGALDLERLWALPPSAELFCGDGRITAGHFALLARLRDERRLDQAIVFDRLDPEPPAGPLVRERELAERLLAEWDVRLPLLVLTGAFHARLEAAEGETMAVHLARRRPGLRPVMLDYASGQCRSRGLQDVSGPMPEAPLVLHIPQATPAVVPGHHAA